MKTALGELLNELTAIRYRTGMTQQEVGDHIGIGRAAVNRLENSAHNHRAPNLSTLLRYAEAVGAKIHATLDTP